MMTFATKKYVYIMTLFLCLISFQPAFAFSFDPLQLVEDQLLRIIDEEFYKMVDDPENLEWTEDYGVQPKDTYELDYAEKCMIIAGTRNKKAIAACAVILGSD